MASPNPHQQPVNIIYSGDVLTEIKKIKDKSVHCLVCSPPYFNLRNYKVAATSWPAVEFSIFGFSVSIPAMKCCLGLEDNPMAFVGHLVLIFRECKRVLRDDGTLWVNMGDSYNGYPGNVKKAGKLSGKNQHARDYKPTGYGLLDKKLKPKDLIGIPWMLSFALRDDGWFLRQDIIWSKGNCMPESVGDRCTKSHEYFFMFSQQQRYFYDAEAIKTPAITIEKERRAGGLQRDRELNYNSKRSNFPEQYLEDTVSEAVLPTVSQKKDKQRGHSRTHEGFNDRWDNMTKEEQQAFGANKRSVWTVNPKPFKDAHFAVFPEELITDPIKAGTSEHGVCSACGSQYVRIVDKNTAFFGGSARAGKTPDEINATGKWQGGVSGKTLKSGPVGHNTTMGWKATCNCEAPIIPATVLDIFMGAGTTAVVCRKLNRYFLGIELNPEYVNLINSRMEKSFGILNDINY